MLVKGAPAVTGRGDEPNFQVQATCLAQEHALADAALPLARTIRAAAPTSALASAIIALKLVFCFTCHPSSAFLHSQLQKQPLRYTPSTKTCKILNIVTMPAQNDVEMQYQSAEPMDANKPSPSSPVSLAPDSKYPRRSLTFP